MRFVGGLVLLAVAGAGCGATQLRPCGPALCGTYSVWENREARSGRKVDLKIVVLPAADRARALDPVFVLAGGPGQPATTWLPVFADNRAMRARRDIVFIDQRGTGGSHPLACDFHGEPPDPRRILTSAYPVDVVRACRERLSRVADLTQYTTSIAADDFDEVRAWLGYRQVVLWGASYGTLMAQVYLRRHPQSVRAAVLLGVLPLDELFPLHVAASGQRVFDLMVAEHARDLPGLRADLERVIERVRQGVDVKVRGVRVRPGPVAFLEGLRHSLYGDSRGAMPGLLHRAAAGEWTPLLERLVDAELDLELAMGLNLSVTCAEGIPFITDAISARETRGTLLGTGRIDEQRAACREWVRGSVPEDFHRPLQSDVPVLLMSGGRDPVTPPDFGERVARGLSRARHVVFPRAAHADFGSCGEKIWTEFIGSDGAKVDATCAAR